MSFYGGFAKYVSVAERKELALESIERLKKKNPNIAPVIVTGKSLTRTWWGKSWNVNLESYADYKNRISRGRSYVRNSAVLDLQITQGTINALVQGSGSKPYQITIAILPLAQKSWEELTKECAGKIDSLQELIDGKFPKGLSELFTVRGKGLFPAPREINLKCNCPDGARMCKHVAAALYGVGVRLDEDPTLFFKFRGVNVEALISETITKQTKSLLEKSKTKSRRIMEDTDVSGMFGIEIENDRQS
jgi:uncharacterized Zn finger protein